MKKIESLFLISTFFPFISPIPLNTDLQPICGILGLLLLLSKLKVSLDVLVVYLFLLYISIYFFVDLLRDSYDLSKQSSVYYGIIIIMAYKKTSGYTVRIFKYSLYIYFLFLMLSLILPDIYYHYQMMIVNNREGVQYEILEGSLRGASILAPEPSFFAAILSSFLVINEKFFIDNIIVKKIWVLNICIIIICIVFNKSGSGLLILLLYIFYLVTKYVKYKMVVLSIGVLFIIYFVQNFQEDIASFGRAFDILFNIVENKADFDDASFLIRINDFFTGIYSLLYFPFGVGTGDVPKAINNIWIEQNFNLLKYSGRSGLVSAFAMGLVEFGLPFLIFVIFIFFYRNNSHFLYKCMAFFLLSFSVSFGFPLIWTLVNLKVKK